MLDVFSKIFERLTKKTITALIRQSRSEKPKNACDAQVFESKSKKGKPKNEGYYFRESGAVFNRISARVNKVYC